MRKIRICIDTDLLPTNRLARTMMVYERCEDNKFKNITREIVARFAPRARIYSHEINLSEITRHYGCEYCLFQPKIVKFLACASGVAGREFQIEFKK